MGMKALKQRSATATGLLDWLNGTGARRGQGLSLRSADLALMYGIMIH